MPIQWYYPKLFTKSQRQTMCGSNLMDQTLCWQDTIFWKVLISQNTKLKFETMDYWLSKILPCLPFHQRIWTEILHDIVQNNLFIKYWTAKKFLKINTRNILSYKHHPYKRQYYSFEKLRTTSSNLSEIKDHDTW